jgi:hypothetical protein
MKYNLSISVWHAYQAWDMCVGKEAFIQGADAGLKYVLHVALLTPLSLLEDLHKRHARL